MEVISENQNQNQNQNQYQAQPPVKPDSGLVWGILTTLLCCLPFGIVSIVYAAKVDGLYYAGHYEEAQSAAKSAKNWALAAGITGISVGIIYLFLIIIGVAASL